MAEVDLNVICKNCGSEVSPYITECPYCGQRLRKRAPKLSRQEEGGVDIAPAPKRRLRRPGLRLGRPGRRARAREEAAEKPLAWLGPARPYATIALVLGGAALYLIDNAGTLGLFDLGGIFGPLNGDWWRLGTSQFNYDNVGYLFAVGVALAIFGTSLERRYSPLVTLAIFLGCGAAGMYAATAIESFPVALGGNGSALGLVGAWFVRDLRDRRSGYDTESDLLGVAAIAAVLAAMPLLDTTANGWTGLGGAALGCLVGLALPERS
jgi:membrane associated rhomboid family serine protease